MFLLKFPTDKNGQVTIKIGGATIQAEFADTSEERARGLSGREKLGENEGMLFVFEGPSRHGIWMKNMKFAIDIIWISPDKKIADIAESVSPDTYPRVFRPRKPALYVLEIKAGLFAKTGARVGDLVDFR